MSVRNDTGLYTLKDSPFFRLQTRKKLAELLQVSLLALKEMTSSEESYKRKWKHKTDKDSWLELQPSPEQAPFYRPIDIPAPGLKKVQGRIAKLLSRISPPDWLFSPCKGRSYVDNAARHKGAHAFWLLDIKDYFPSCTSRKIAHFFRSDLQCSADVTAILVRLTTYQSSLPQGSPCSPILAYFCNLALWAEIENIVVGDGLKHSVYADDITISGKLIYGNTIWQIKQAIKKHGFAIKKEKELSLINGPADITGTIVVGDRTKLPYRQLKRLFELRKLRHAAKGKRLQAQLDNQIAGRIAQKRQVEGG